jgi:hypothetical protein
METINKISDEEIEITSTTEIKRRVYKKDLEAEKAYLEEMLARFDK